MSPVLWTEVGIESCRPGFSRHRSHGSQHLLGSRGSDLRIGKDRGSHQDSHHRDLRIVQARAGMNQANLGFSSHQLCQCPACQRQPQLFHFCSLPQPRGLRLERIGHDLYSSIVGRTWKGYSLGSSHSLLGGQLVWNQLNLVIWCLLIF